MRRLPAPLKLSPGRPAANNMIEKIMRHLIKIDYQDSPTLRSPIPALSSLKTCVKLIQGFVVPLWCFSKNVCFIHISVGRKMFGEFGDCCSKIFSFSCVGECFENDFNFWAR